MSGKRDIDTKIRARRARTEARLSALLKRTDSSATLNDIKETIFYERPEQNFAEYVANLIALVDPAHRIDSDELLPVIQDAWNYLPHLRLDGHCPAKLMPRPMILHRPGTSRTRPSRSL